MVIKVDSAQLGPRRLALPVLWRRTPARYAAPLLAVGALAVLAYGGAKWRGSEIATVEWIGGAVLLIGPLIGGLTSWNVLSHLRLLGSEAETLPAEGRRAWTLLGGPLTLAWAIHVLVLAGSLCLTYLSGAQVTGAPAQVLVQLAALAAYACVGYSLTCFFPFAATPVLLTVLFFLMPIGAYGGGLFSTLWFEVGGASGAGPGFSFNAVVSVAQFALLAGVALAASFAPAIRSRTVGLAWKLVPLLALASALIAGAWLTATGEARFTLKEDANYVCSDTSPRVCVVADSGGQLGAIQDFASEVEAVLGDLGVSSSGTTYRQFVQEPPTNGDRGFFLDQGDLLNREVTARKLTPYLLIDRQCIDSLRSSPQAIDSVLLAVQYVASRVGDTTPSPVGDSSEEREWVGSVLNSASACDVAGIDSLGPVAS